MAFDGSLFGSAGFPALASGNRPHNSPSPCPERRKLIRPGAGRKKFPVPGNFPPSQRQSPVGCGIARCSPNRRGSAACARAGDFEAFAFDLKAQPAAPFADHAGNPVVLDLDRGAAAAADQELADMRMVGPNAGNKGLARVEPMRESVGQQKIEAAIYPGGCCRALFPQPIEQFIGRQRTLCLDQYGEDLSAQPRQARAGAPADGLCLLQGWAMPREFDHLVRYRLLAHIM